MQAPQMQSAINRQASLHFLKIYETTHMLGNQEWQRLKKFVLRSYSPAIRYMSALRTIQYICRLTETSLKTSDWVVRQFRAVAIRTRCSFNGVHNDLSILSFVFVKDCWTVEESLESPNYLQNMFWQSGNDSRWFLSKRNIENKVNGTGETRPPPLRGKCH